MTKITKNLGFTLIELLVVISIIGFLATSAMVLLNSARIKARDAKRLSDMKQVLTALALYYDQNNDYPYAAHSGCYDDWETTCDSAGNFIDALRAAGFMAKVPLDPLNASPYFYAYYHYNAGNYGCSVSNGDYFVLGIRTLESGPHPSAQSPGWSCPSRNWQPEFDWVTGGFVK